jgi:hypothetical protein
MQVSGPATKVGQGATSTTVDTGSDGSQQTTTTTSTPTYHYDYAGNKVTQTTTETTTTTKSDGSSSTTTSSPGGNSSGTGTGAAADSADLCALHPGIVACDTLGTPDGTDPTWGTRNVTFTPEDIGMPSGCPGPRTFTVRSINFTLNYQPACDIAPVVSAGLVAFCALGCALWIMSVIKA